MKILIVHNDYGTYSGEEAVVDQMIKIYQSSGYGVKIYRRSTADIQDNIGGKISAFIGGIYPQKYVKEFRAKLAECKPDVVHGHNLYPFIGPAILRECKHQNIKVVMTIHNFRLICPTGLFLRDNRPCELCLERGDEWGCVKYNCEKSWLKSLGYALRNYVARKSRYYLDNVDKYCCLTEFQRSKLIAAGYDASKIEVIPNSNNTAPRELTFGGDYVGYCGRLSSEKGLDMLVEVARRNPDIEIRFAGSFRDGYLLDNIPSNCKLLGHLSGEEFNQFIDGARFLVMASRWYEGFPMAILDAVNYGKCMLAPNHGGFTEITKNNGEPMGELFEPNNIDDLEQKLVALWSDKSKIATYSRNGQKAVAEHYSPEVIRLRWQSVLESL